MYRDIGSLKFFEIRSDSNCYYNFNNFISRSFCTTKKTEVRKRYLLYIRKICDASETQGESEISQK